MITKFCKNRTPTSGGIRTLFLFTIQHHFACVCFKMAWSSPSLFPPLSFSDRLWFCRLITITTTIYAATNIVTATSCIFPFAMDKLTLITPVTPALNIVKAYFCVNVFRSSTFWTIVGSTFICWFGVPFISLSSVHYCNNLAAGWIDPTIQLIGFWYNERKKLLN
jgi:hypothetical protein